MMKEDKIKPEAEKPAKRKWCRLMLISITMAIILLITYSQFYNFGFLATRAGLLWYFLMLSIPIIALASVIRINLNPSQFKGQTFSTLLFLLSSYFLIISTAVMEFDREPNSKVKQDVLGPALNQFLLVILISFALIVSIWIFAKTRAHKKWAGSIIMGVISGFVGALLGTGAQLMYVNGNLAIGTVAGAYFGFLTGVCFFALMNAFPENVKQRRNYVSLGASLGMLAGIICSTLVHLALKILFNVSTYSQLAMGSAFGILAGALLGSIIAAILKTTENEEVRGAIS